MKNVIYSDLNIISYRLFYICFVNIELLSYDYILLKTLELFSIIIDFMSRRTRAFDGFLNDGFDRYVRF